MYAIRYKELVKKDEGINNNMAKKRDKKNKLRGKWLRGIIIVYLLLILCNLFREFPSRLGNLHSIPVSEEWYLIVVNRWNEIPEDYRVELTELSNGQKVDSRIYPYLQEKIKHQDKDTIIKMDLGNCVNKLEGQIKTIAKVSIWIGNDEIMKAAKELQTFKNTARRSSLIRILKNFIKQLFQEYNKTYACGEPADIRFIN